jgi:ankyrin repeat protein
MGLKLSWRPQQAATLHARGHNFGSEPQRVLLLQLGWTSLHEAARDGHLSVVKQLLLSGASVSATDKVTPSSLL